MEWNYMEVSWVEKKENCWALIHALKIKIQKEVSISQIGASVLGTPPLYYKFKVRHPAWAGALGKAQWLAINVDSMRENSSVSQGAS